MKKWFFDQYSSGRKPDGPKSWVQLSDTEEGQELNVYINDQKSLSFSGSLDQWGTWIDITATPTTVAQEWSTKSFVQALMAGLTEFAKICDLEGNTDQQTPEYVEEPDNG